MRCVDQSLYCGITNDLNNRLQQHNKGTGAKYTRSRRPVKLLATCATQSRSDALKLEYRIKKTPARKKLSIIENAKDHTEMVTTQTLQLIRNGLQSVVENLQQLTVSVDAIATALENVYGEQAPRPKAKRAPVRKKVVVKNGVVETIKRVPSTKIVYDILQKSNQGLDISALKKATGYDQRKIYNITFRLKKEGKIKNTARGIYSAR